MPYTTIEAAKTKERLGDLRKEKKLTFEQLSACLNTSGVPITHTSLRNYEIDDPLHPLYGRTSGMSIQNLVALAEFYDVSVDYLLGLSDSKKLQNHQINKELGLSDKAINQIRNLNTNIVHEVEYDDLLPSIILTRILETEEFKLFIELAYKGILGHLHNTDMEEDGFELDWDAKGKVVFKDKETKITLRDISDFYLSQSLSYIKASVDMVTRSYNPFYENRDITINENHVDKENPDWYTDALKEVEE